MKGRIKAVRQDAQMSQAEFAAALGMSVNAVSQMERDVIKPSNRTIELICERFLINREWLTDGTGEMKRPPLDEVAVIVADILDKGEDDPFYKWIIAIIKSYRKLDDKHKEIFRKTLDEL